MRKRHKAVADLKGTARSGHLAQQQKNKQNINPMHLFHGQVAEDDNV